MKMGANTFYMRSPQEMASLFPDLPLALSNTLEIAERCNVDLIKKATICHFSRFLRDLPLKLTCANFARKVLNENMAAMAEILKFVNGWNMNSKSSTRWGLMPTF
jgi:DNA polymerase-3 subunit alpha